MLTSGMVPALFADDEKDQIIGQVISLVHVTLRTVCFVSSNEIVTQTLVVWCSQTAFFFSFVWASGKKGSGTPTLRILCNVPLQSG